MFIILTLLHRVLLLSSGLTFPSGNSQRELMTELYSECGVKPSEVAYVEAHGAGTKKGDPAEANAIADFFCTPDRTGPLMVGSTKSNIGNTEAAGGKYIYIYIYMYLDHPYNSLATGIWLKSGYHPRQCENL